MREPRAGLALRPQNTPLQNRIRAALGREAGGRSRRLGRRDRRWQGVGERDKVTGGRDPRWRASTSLRPQASDRRAGTRRAWCRGAQPGGRCGSSPLRSGLQKPRGGGQTLRHHRSQRKDFGSRNLQDAPAEGRPVQSGRSQTLCPLSPASPLYTTLLIRTPNPFLA